MLYEKNKEIMFITQTCMHAAYIFIDKNKISKQLVYTYFER